MSFLAKLFINGRTINVLDTNIRFYQQINPESFKPAALPMGGVFSITMEADGTTDLLNYALSPDLMCEGYIRFYKRDGMTRMQDYEFFDTHIVCYQRDFEGQYGKVTTDRFVLSPGILRIGDMVFEKWWKVSDLAVKDAPVPEAEKLKPKIAKGYFESEDGKKEFRPKKNDIVYFMVSTKDMAGESIDIDLSDSKILFEHEGKPLDDGIISGLDVTGNKMKIELKVLKKKK